MYFYTNAVNLPLPAVGAYADLDITAYAPTFPTTAKFAVILVQNASASTVSFAARHPNQTGYDDYDTGNVAASSYSQHIIPALNGKISIKASSANVILYLQGYLGERDASYLADGTPLSPLAPGWVSGSWATLDLTTVGVPTTATFAIGVVAHTSTANGFALRPYGSTESRPPIYAPMYMSFIIPVFDGKMQVYRENQSDATFIVRILGYMQDGYPNVEGVLRNTETTGSYQSGTISTTPQVKAFVGHAWNTGSTGGSSTYNYAVRMNGSTDDYYGVLYYQRWDLIPLSAAGVFQQKISSATVDLYDYGLIDAPTASLTESVRVSETITDVFFTETLTESIKVSDDTDNKLLGFLLPGGVGSEPDVFYETLEESATVAETLSIELEPFRLKENFTVAETVEAWKWTNGIGNLTLPLLDLETKSPAGFIGNFNAELNLVVDGDGQAGSVGISDATNLVLRLEVEGSSITSFVGDNSLDLPMFGLSGNGLSGNDGSANIQLYQLEFEASQASESAGQADIDLPSLEISGEGNVGATGTAVLNIELVVAGAGVGAGASASGDTIGDGELVLPLPRFSATLVSDTSSETEIDLPVLTLTGVGLTGQVGAGAVTLTVPTVLGSGSISAVGIGQLQLPMLISAGIAVFDVVTAVGEMSYHAVNTQRAAITDYTGYAFNSLAVVDGVVYGATSTGIYRLSGDTDNGAAIQTIVTKNHLLSSSALKKRMTEVYVDIVSSSPPTMAAWAEETCVDVGTTDISSGGHTGKSHLPRGLTGRSIGVSVIGNSGQVEEISEIELIAETSVSSRRRH